MVDSINPSNIRVDDKGRVSFSGLGSGIDYQAAVDSIIEARRIPIDRLETRITDNETKVAAYQNLRTLLNGLQTALKNLRGAVTVDNSGNAFASKEAFASVSRTDGTTASAASNLLGVSLTNSAAVGSHTVEILQTAAAHKIASDSYSSTTAKLGFTSGDQFTIEGTTITVSADDTLLSLRDRINAANTGTSPTGVSASIVSVSANQHYLVLTKDTAGSAISLSDTTNSPLATAGILAGDGSAKNLLQAPRTAQIYADGLLDQSNTAYETVRLSNASATLGSNGTIRFDDGNGTYDLAYTSGQTVQDLANTINADATLQAKGISAAVVTEGGQVRLKLTTTGEPFTMTEAGGGDALTSLGMDNARLLIERNSNTINDLFAGVTLTLFQAEVGSTVKIDVERDLNAVKEQVTSFVDAYNTLKNYINTQTYVDPTTGQASEDAVLLSSRALKDIENQLNQIVGSGTAGVSNAFSVLAQIGITFVDNNSLADPLMADTLQIDDKKLDEALLNNADDVRRLFSFDFSSSNPQITMLGFTNRTDYSADGYVLNIGPIGSAQETAVAAADSAALLNDTTNSVGATTSGQFTLNGTAITYDVTTDSLDSLASRINAAKISGISARVVTDEDGGKQLQINSASQAITVGGDTGDLLANLGFTTTGTLITSANIGGAADGSDNGTVTISGMTITVTSQSGAEGLRMLYTGTGAANGIQLDYTVGVATQLYSEIESILDSRTGSVENEIQTLTQQNGQTQTRMDTMLERLERQRESLLARFLAMETALTSMNSLLDNLRQSFDAMNNSKN